MAARKMLRIGIIGSGFGTYGLLPAFQRVKNCQVVALCTKNSHRVPASGKQLKMYDNWKKMLESERLDAVAVAVAPVAQYEIVREALKKNLHVFAEKPLALSVNEAKDLQHLAQKKNRVTVIDFIFPEIAAWQKVKKMLDEKKFGELHYIRVDWNFLSYDLKNKVKGWKTNAKQGGGSLSFYFSHVLYYLEFFAGKITDLSSLLSYAPESLNGGDIGVDVLLKFEKNVNGFAHISCNTPGIHRHQLLFQCEKGIILLANENSTTRHFWIQTIDKNGKQKMIVLSEKQEDDVDERVITVTKLAKRFISTALENKQTTPSFSDGLRVQQLIDLVRKNQV